MVYHDKHIEFSYKEEDFIKPHTSDIKLIHSINLATF